MLWKGIKRLFDFSFLAFVSVLRWAFGFVLWYPWEFQLTAKKIETLSIFLKPHLSNIELMGITLIKESCNPDNVINISLKSSASS